MIYATPFQHDTRQTTGPSQPAGFETIDAVVAIMGPDFTHRGPTSVIYGPDNERVIFSKAIFSIDEAGNTE